MIVAELITLSARRARGVPVPAVVLPRRRVSLTDALRSETNRVDIIHMNIIIRESLLAHNSYSALDTTDREKDKLY